MKHNVGFSRARFASVLLRAGGFAFVWLVMTEGELSISVLPIAGIALATGASMLLWPPGSFQIRFRVLPSFAAFFLRQSLIGGFDVARRALHPAMPIRPGFMRYRTRLAREPQVVLFSDVTSLLPGTLAADIEHPDITVHVLDTGMETAETLGRLEDEVESLLAREAGSGTQG